MFVGTTVINVIAIAQRILSSPAAKVAQVLEQMIQMPETSDLWALTAPA